MQYYVQLKFVALVAWATAVASQDFSVSRRSGVNYADLAKQLSKTAQIYRPGSDLFDDATARWSNLSTPIANVVVVPSNEQDIVKTVQFANKNSLPFLAVNGVHGSITTLGKMDCGIEILMTQLNRITIAKDGKTATIGGGVMSKDLTDALWAAGKQTVTGTCECVSYLGPGLGGGHGWLQGRHGLVSDQYVSLKVVLANGDLVTVDAKSKLFWAMKGAGHNFGIVTSVTSKIYDLKRPNYALQTLIFSGDKVEAVYKLANEQWYSSGKAMPVDLINWSYWFFDPTIDPEKPVIAMYLIQEGVDAVSTAYSKPFVDLGPLINQPTSGTYRDLAKWTGISLADGPCQISGNANPRFPIYLKSYNPKAQAKVYDLFREATTKANSPFSRALFMFEGYSMQGVQAFDEQATAFAYREDNLLVAPLLSYTPNGPELDRAAYTLGNKIRKVLQDGSGETSLHTYVNYAYGDETQKSWYGSEQWRQRRLSALKKDFDPKGKFSFYGPIA